MTVSYIQRTLIREGKLIPESECFLSKGIFIVLAEPGAGKSDLLDSVGRKHACKRWRASVFRYAQQINVSKVLIVDALDEVARTGDSSTDEVIVKAMELGAEIIVLSSRADVWNKERERFVEEASGIKPIVLRLEPFSAVDQENLFQNLFPQENFKSFHDASSAFGLEPLLGNPMFLRLFAEGFIQAGNKFTSKAAAFQGAVDRLASTDGKTSAGTPPLPLREILKHASGLFAKLLLSGSSGIATEESVADSQFPYMLVLERDRGNSGAFLNTRLFKPSDDPANHEPFHRIVAEFCAASHLAELIENPSIRLTLARCMAMIAPNGALRDDLRGLLGWMAALGSQAIQSAAIDLDPYAVVANGDASQLSAKSKHRLLNGLSKQAEQDPYFRRSDGWRTFSLANFFSDGLATTVASILENKEDETHLRRLILEMLSEAQVPDALSVPLTELALDKSQDYILRMLAARCLTSQNNFIKEYNIRALLQSSVPDCLKVAADIILQTTQPPIDRSLVLELLKFAGRAEIREAERKGNISDRLFVIKEVIRTRTLEDTIWLLDNLTSELKCTCGATKPLQCQCRKDASKVIGRLLDRFFELQDETYSKALIWSWIKNLQFGHGISDTQSLAVRKLKVSHALRQELQRTAFMGLTDPDEIWGVQSIVQWGHMHSGISFSAADQEALADWAFRESNAQLWSAMMWRHDIYSKRATPIQMRTIMRRQANANMEFMKIWARHNRSWRKHDREQRMEFPRRRKWRKRSEDTQAANLQNLQENRAAIEAGSRWWWTHHFAHYFMHFPEKLHELTDSEETVDKTLLNCVGTLAAHVPSLNDLATGKGRNVAEVLHAACLVHFRKTGNLVHIDLTTLRAVKTEAGSAKAYKEGEAAQLEAEVDRLLFQSDSDRKAFAVAYFEPQLDVTHNRLWSFMHNKAFDSIKVDLAWEWLVKQPNASLEAMDTLFSICAQAGMAKELAGLASERCGEVLATGLWDTDELAKTRLEFWRLRHFFFCGEEQHGLWSQLLADPKSIFSLERKTGRWDRDSSIGWPNLTAEKVFRILNAFVDVWPKVRLPSSWGTGSPEGETAYRYMRDVAWQIGKDVPDARLPIISRLLVDERFADFRNDLLSMQAAAIRQKQLQDFTVPRASEVVDLLDTGHIASIEDLRALLLDELAELQKWIDGSETNPISLFWPHAKRVDENTARNRIVERLQVRFLALDTSVVIEHQMAAGNRCDFTLTKMVQGTRKLLVCEVKGQWHSELFTAAKTQLNERYTIHPDASLQGVYLVLWFGNEEKVAGLVNSEFGSAAELQRAVIASLPLDILGMIDVFVLDVSQKPSSKALSKN
jgi:hypothetical protein